MNEDQDRVNERAEQLVESHHHLMEELLNLRKKHGLSQDLVGERMGVSQPAVASLENHESNPTLSSIRRYALAIGARIDHVVIDDLEVIAVADSVIQQFESWLTQPAQPFDYYFEKSTVSTNAQ